MRIQSPGDDDTRLFHHILCFAAGLTMQTEAADSCNGFLFKLIQHNIWLTGFPLFVN